MKEISLNEALAIINNSDSEMAEEIAEELEAFYEISGKILLQSSGELSELTIGEAIVLADGDLDVGGLVIDRHQAVHSLLIVLGDLTCENLITLSNIYITDNLAVEHTILADSRCNDMLMVGGNIACTTLLDYGHTVIAGAVIDSDELFSRHAVEDMTGALEAHLTRESLVPEVMLEDQAKIREDLRKTIAYIRQGGTVFRRS